jgi:hypothetical protein
MSKRETKAERILNDSAMRLEAALIRLRTAQAVVSQRQAIAEALEEAHKALEKELAPTPRKTAKKPAASPQAQKEQSLSKDPICGVCGNPQDFQDHFHPSPNYHDFEGPKPVARAPRKSRQKSEPAPSGQSSETGTDAAMVASNVGD